MKALVYGSMAGLILSCSVAAWAQTQPEGDDAVRVEPAPHMDKSDEYIGERMALSGGRGERVSGTLRLRLANGRTMQLVDRVEDNDEYRRYVYERYLPAVALHVVAVQLYEGSAYLAIHSGAGSKVWLPGPPILSRNGRRFIAASSELEDGHAPNMIEIWRVGESGLRREFALKGAHAWSPENVAWDGSNSVRWTQVWLDPSGRADRRVGARLLNREGRWSFEGAAW